MEDMTHLVNNDEETAENQDTPDCDIGKDASWKRVCIDSNGPVPV